METYREKIKGLRDAKKEIDLLKAGGKRIVFTNGCFDILHPGHVRYLSRARGLGDYLVVAVNSDRSVKALKGTKRPIIPQDERAEILAAMELVDAVVIFDEDTPEKTIRFLMPHILVKGEDWREEDIIGSDIVKAAGGEVIRIPFINGFSTSKIIDKIKNMAF